MRSAIIWMIMVSILLWMTSCGTDYVFEDNQQLPSAGWSYEQKVRFEVPIEDTVSQYNVYLNLRHSNDYAYNNIWVWVYTTFPSGKQLKNRVDLPLAEVSGKWHGTGTGDIKSVQLYLQERARFPEKGIYVFEVEQNMRDNPLEEVMDVGLTVEVWQEEE